MERLKAHESQLRKKESKLRERETYLREKEQFLNLKENELLKRERDLITQCEEQTAEINEKERLLNEILKRYELPVVAGDLKKALQTAMEITSQESTCGGISIRGGSFSHNLKDSKQFCSDSFSPLKSGGCFSIKDHQALRLSKEYCCGGSSNDKNSSLVLNSLKSGG